MRDRLSIAATFCAMIVAVGGCASDDQAHSDAYRFDCDAVGVAARAIEIDSLSSWERYRDGPVFRDQFPGYEVASDPHVFHDPEGKLRMLYTGDEDGHASIKMAVGTAYDTWEPVGVLISGGSAPAAGPNSGKETSFYYYNNERAKHQIYYIAYEDGDTTTGYTGEIYVAESDSIEGPYADSADPILGAGEMAGHSVYTMTSPSVVEHDGSLYIAFLGWDAPPDLVTTVWILGARSTDHGVTWEPVQEIDAAIGMEGQITKGPDGLYYAARTAEHNGDEAIFVGRATHPFGLYEEFPHPVLTKQRPGGKGTRSSRLR